MSFFSSIFGGNDSTPNFNGNDAGAFYVDKWIFNEPVTIGGDGYPLIPLNEQEATGLWFRIGVNDVPYILGMIGGILESEVEGGRACDEYKNALGSIMHAMTEIHNGIVKMRAKDAKVENGSK